MRLFLFDRASFAVVTLLTVFANSSSSFLKLIVSKFAWAIADFVEIFLLSTERQDLLIDSRGLKTIVFPRDCFFDIILLVSKSIAPQESRYLVGMLSL